MDGWARLGAALGGRNDQSAYQDQLLRNYRTQNAAYSRDKALEDATLARNRRIALEGIGDTLAPLGLGDFTGLFQAGGGNAAQLSQAALNLGEFNTRGQAKSAALGGDLATAQANLLSLANAPVQMTRVQDGVTFNPILGPDQPLRTTPLGDARVAERQAAAGRANAAAVRELAQAGKYDAQAALGGFAPRASITDDGTGEVDRKLNSTDVGAPVLQLGTPPNTYVSPGDVVFMDPSAPMPRGPLTRAEVRQKVTKPEEVRQALASAERAIQNGKDPAAVRARLQEFGIDPALLD